MVRKESFGGLVKTSSVLGLPFSFILHYRGEVNVHSISDCFTTDKISKHKKSGMKQRVADSL